MRSGWLRIAVALAAGVPACRYSVDPDTGKFHCASDADCGGGWHCFAACHASGFTAYCIENGSCEPCPGLQSDPANCGSCGHACSPNEACVDSVCVPAFSADGGADAGLSDGGGAGMDGGVPDGSVDAGLADGGPSDGGSEGGVDAGALLDGGSGDGGSDAGDGGP